MDAGNLWPLPCKQMHRFLSLMGDITTGFRGESQFLITTYLPFSYHKERKKGGEGS